jgi:hypothetical protein
MVRRMVADMDRRSAHPAAPVQVAPAE